MTVNLLIKQLLEFLSLKGDCTDSPDSIHVKLPHCWKSHVAAHMDNIPRYQSDNLLITSLIFSIFLLALYRGSYMSAHVLLNLLNELGKRDKMQGLPSILSFFRNEFNKFNTTGARMLDSIYHMT